MDVVLFSLFLAILLSFYGVVGDFFIKLSGNGPKFVELHWFIIGLLIYASSAFGWFYVMKHVKLATLGVFFAVSTVLFLLIFGVYYFKESLNYFEIAGIILAIVSLILLGRFA